ncbi:MAG: hypothetical protein SPL22_10520 [Treponema sp.]|uniref:hypothetical protein n=1 Tax=Treponema sp. TaxID=166 RepID=UPI002A908F16|nr:hypothetical protein [Treponema sp.]MDY6398150.1 hypothetical protein [Treponema sp.]
MSGVLAYVQNQILEFSLEEQLYLLAYIANNVNKKNKAKHTSAKKKSYFGALKNKISYIVPDFDADFAEYM